MGCKHNNVVGYEYVEEVAYGEFGSRRVWVLSKTKCMACGEIIEVKE